MTPVFREAREGDIATVVSLLRDDALGQGRETDDLGPYLAAFREMADQPGNSLIVGEASGAVIAVYQLTIISGVSLSATCRAQIEGIRVVSHLRGQGIGKALLDDAEARARKAGAGLLQFTTNRSRSRAHEFYRRAGYVDSHLGFKKWLAASSVRNTSG